MRMRMTTPVTARNGLVVTKLGIGPCSFITGYRVEGDDEIAAGDGHDLHHPTRGYLGVGGGGHVVRGAGEADEGTAEMIRGDIHRDAARRAGPVLEAEGGGRFRPVQGLEGAQRAARA